MAQEAKLGELSKIQLGAEFYRQFWATDFRIVGDGMGNRLPAPMTAVIEAICQRNWMGGLLSSGENWLDRICLCRDRNDVPRQVRNMGCRATGFRLMGDPKGMRPESVIERAVYGIRKMYMSHED